MSDVDFMAMADARSASRGKTEAVRQGEEVEIKGYYIQLPVETHRALKAGAAMRGMTISALTDMAIKTYLGLK